MNRIADEIKRAVTMPELLARYGLSDGTKERIPCPIHQGKDKNFAVKDRHYKCYVCGAEGSVIDFVMQYFGTDYKGAINRLNDDFHLGLPLGKAMDSDAARKALREAEKRRREQERKRRAIEEAEQRYYAALDVWVYLDTMRRENAPTGITEPFRAEYAYALKNLDAADHELQQAQNALYDLKHGVTQNVQSVQSVQGQSKQQRG